MQWLNLDQQDTRLHPVLSHGIQMTRTNISCWYSVIGMGSLNDTITHWAQRRCWDGWEPVMGQNMGWDALAFCDGAYISEMIFPNWHWSRVVRHVSGAQWLSLLQRPVLQLNVLAWRRSNTDAEMCARHLGLAEDNEVVDETIWRNWRNYFARHRVHVTEAPCCYFMCWPSCLVRILVAQAQLPRCKNESR